MYAQVGIRFSRRLLSHRPVQLLHEDDFQWCRNAILALGRMGQAGWGLYLLAYRGGLSGSSLALLGAYPFAPLGVEEFELPRLVAEELRILQLYLLSPWWADPKIRSTFGLKRKKV